MVRTMSKQLGKCSHEPGTKLYIKAKKLETGKNGQQKDIATAIKLYKQAAGVGHICAMHDLGRLFQNGEERVFRKDVPEAAKWFRKAAEHGNTLSMNSLGWLLLVGEDGVEKDIQAAMELFQQAADRGDRVGMYNLARLLEQREGEITRDVPKAVEWYRKAAKHGHPPSMNKLGWLLQEGKDGVEKDIPAAMKLFQQAADRGDPVGMHNLARLLEKGEGGVTRDVPKAVEWYRKAAKKEHPPSMNSLGWLLKQGSAGVEKNIVEAKKLFRQAVKKDCTPAMTNLGRLLESGGPGVAKDEAMAKKLYKKAARRRDTNAKIELMRIQQKGANTLSKDVPMANSTGSGGSIRSIRGAADHMLEDTTEDSSEISFSETSSQADSICSTDSQSGISRGRSCRKAKRRITPSNDPKYEVFISHAAPEREKLAEPIYKGLAVSHKIPTFLDRHCLKIQDRTGPEEIERAMETARIGIFILSPEFAARKWPMKELIYFLERDNQDKAKKRTRPTLLPIFWGLSIDECDHADEQVYGQESKYRKLLEERGFFKDDRQTNCSTEAAIKALKQAPEYSGEERKDKSSAVVVTDVIHSVVRHLRASG